MSKNGAIFLIIFLVSLIAVGTYFTLNDFNEEVLKPVYDVTYTSDANDACLTFYKKGKYSMYDCDSEPTAYFFDSENECTYKTKNSEIRFNCKYGDNKNGKIKVLSWNNEKFEFMYEGEKITFNKKTE